MSKRRLIRNMRASNCLPPVTFQVLDFFRLARSTTRCCIIYLVIGGGATIGSNARLPVPIYDPVVHYQQIRDSWIGLPIPTGE